MSNMCIITNLCKLVWTFLAVCFCVWVFSEGFYFWRYAELLIFLSSLVLSVCLQLDLRWVCHLSLITCHLSTVGKKSMMRLVCWAIPLLEVCLPKIVILLCNIFVINIINNLLTCWRQNKDERRSDFVLIGVFFYPLFLFWFLFW